MNLLEMLATQAQNPQANPLVRRLAQHALGTQQGHDFGSVPVLSGAAETVTHPAMAAAAQLGLLLEAAQTAGRAGLGGVYSGAGRFGQTDAGRVVGQKMPLLAKLGDLGFGAMAQQAAQAPQEPDANLFAQALAAHEAAASGHEFTSFVADSAADPSNYLGGVGELMKGTKLAELGKVLQAADRAQGLPVEALLGKLAKQRAARAAAEEAARLAAQPPLTQTMLQNVGYGSSLPGLTTLGADETQSLLSHWIKRANDPIAAGVALGDGPSQVVRPSARRDLALTLLRQMETPPVALPKPIQPLADLLGGAQRTARPSALEGLMGAARGSAAREVAPTLPKRSIAAIEAAIPKVAQPEGLYPGEGVTPDLLDRFAKLRENPNPTDLDIEAEIGAMRDPVTMMQAAYGDKWRNNLTALTGGKWGQPGSGASLRNGRIMLGDLDLTTAVRDYLEARGGAGADQAKAAIKALLPGKEGTGDRVLGNVAADVTAAGALGGAPGGNTPTGGPLALLNQHTGALDDVRDLILGESKRVGTQYPPLDPKFYADRAGVDPAQVPAMLDQLVQEGTLGRLPGGELAVKPGAKSAIADVGGDLAAGGGGFGITGPVGLAERTLTGAAAGGLTGVAGGALAPADSPQERAKHIATGAALGTIGGGNLGAVAPEFGRFAQAAAKQVVADPATWGKRVEGKLLADPEIMADTLAVVKRARGEGGTGVKGLQEAWNAFTAQWKRQAVDTVKQLPQDATYRATVIEGIARDEFGVGELGGRQFQRAVSRERATGAWSLDDPYNQLLIQTGHADKIAHKSDLIGAEFTEAITDKGKPGFTRFGNAVAGGLIGMGSALKTANPVSPVFGVARGAVDREWSAALHHLIGVANDSWREAMANAGTRQKLTTVADDFLAKLAADGVDVTPLQGRGGLFSQHEVAAIAGKQAGDDWHVESEAAIRSVGNRVAYLAGDFRDKLDPKFAERGGTVTSGDRLLGTAERAASKFAPFARWQIRSTPVLLEVAARHPVATLKALQETQRLGEEAKAKGKRAYQAGYDISTETPLLGALARARLGGKQGTYTLNPIKAAVPYADMLGGGDDTPDDATAYQQVSAMLGQIGFGPSPLIQAGAYVGGQDYRAPGSLSRTAGLEQLGTLLPGVGAMQLPTGRNLLDAARGVVEPALADVGVKTTGPASATDPLARRYAELVFDTQGKPLGDASMIHFLSRDTPEAKALWDQAVREEALQAAAGNAVSLTSPIPSTAQGADAAAAQAARAPVTEAQNLVDQLPPVQGAMLQYRIDQYKQAHPESRVYDGSSPAARAQLLLADWERSHNLLAFLPEVYAYQRAIYAEEIGAVKPGTLAQKQRAIDERGGSTAVPGVENRLRVDPGAAQRLRELNRIPGR